MDGHDRDVDRARLQVVEPVLRGALKRHSPLRREQLAVSDVDEGSLPPNSHEQWRQHNRQNAIRRPDREAATRRCRIEWHSSRDHIPNLSEDFNDCGCELLCSLGTTPFGVQKNSGSLRSRRSRPRPWLTADGDKFSLSAARPTCRSVKHNP